MGLTNAGTSHLRLVACEGGVYERHVKASGGAGKATVCCALPRGWLLFGAQGNHTEKETIDIRIDTLIGNRCRSLQQHRWVLTRMKSWIYGFRFRIGIAYFPQSPIHFFLFSFLSRCIFNMSWHFCHAPASFSCFFNKSSHLGLTATEPTPLPLPHPAHKWEADCPGPSLRSSCPGTWMDSSHRTRLHRNRTGLKKERKEKEKKSTWAESLFF